jgi:hypothetical protein
MFYWLLCTFIISQAFRLVKVFFNFFSGGGDRFPSLWGLLDFEHLKTQLKVFGVGLGVDKLNALLPAAVQIDNLVSGDIDDRITCNSHNYYLLCFLYPYYSME